MAKAGRGDDQYMVRFPEGLRAKIKEAADAHGRSMNTEIIERLERHPELVRLHMDVAYLEMENQRLTKELAVAKAALDDSKAASFALQKLLDAEHSEAMALGEAEYDAQQTIEKRFNELKAQSDYLDALKAEMLQLTKERDVIKLEAENRLEEQTQLMEKLRKSHETNALILKGFRKVFVKAADGDDDDLKKLVEVFQTIGEEDD